MISPYVQPGQPISRQARDHNALVESSRRVHEGFADPSQRPIYGSSD
jgi:hypothetical protein